MDLNIKDKNAEKFSRRSVGRCLGFSVIAPVDGSIIICWRPDVVEETTIPLAEPGAAIYGRRLAFGAPSRTEMIFKLRLNKCFLTRISSCEKAHSSADSNDVVVWLLVVVLTLV